MANRLPHTMDIALAIAENSVQGIVVMDEAGHCLYANRAWTELTGFSGEDMQAKPVHDWVHHHHPDGSPFPIEDCPIGYTLGKNENVRNHRDLFFKKDGTPFHVSCAASPIEGEGMPILKILEIRDITDEMEIERRKDEFLAMLAHELRNPLAPIAAAAELLKIGRLDEHGIRQASAVISRQTKHMTGLVNDLLDVSRVTRGLIELDKESLDIKTVIVEAIEQVRPLIETKGHRITTNTRPEAAIVIGDRKRLVQVLANILSNAAKYTPDGGEIQIGIEAQPDMVHVSVRDNGIGMTPEMIERAFELFSQAQRTSDRVQGGLGIGLALVKSLVALHGGSVTASSQGAGKGTVLTLTLPNHTERKLTTPPEESSLALPVARRPLKVMVVEDNMDAAAMLGMLLVALGHQVDLKYTPQAALAAASQEPYEVFLLDIGLPGLEGTELARRLRQQRHNSSAFIVAVSGYGQERDIRVAIDAGFDHHLVKPASLDQVNRLLNSLSEK